MVSQGHYRDLTPTFRSFNYPELSVFLFFPLFIYSSICPSASHRASRWFVKPPNQIPPPPRLESRVVVVVTQSRKVALPSNPLQSKALRRKSERFQSNYLKQGDCEH